MTGGFCQGDFCSEGFFPGGFLWLDFFRGDFILEPFGTPWMRNQGALKNRFPGGFTAKNRAFFPYFH